MSGRGGKARGPGIRSMDALRWLSRVEVAGIEPLGHALGFGWRATYSHVERLAKAGLLERVHDREGSVVAISREGRRAVGADSGGVRVAATRGSGLRHARAVSWVTALLTLRGRDGPAFRRLSHDKLTSERIAGDGIARMVKRRAGAAGYAPELFSGHSLRSGFATTAARAGVAEHRIMRQGRWTTSQAMRGYIQEGELFVDNPSAKLGL